MKYDHEWIAARRADDIPWADIAEHLRTTPKRVRQAHNRWAKRREEPVGEPVETLAELNLAPGDVPEHTADGVTIPPGWREEQRWIKTEEGTVHLKRDPGYIPEEAVDTMWEDMLAELAERSTRPPDIIIPKRHPIIRGPHLLEVAIMDPHIGMLAWGKEVGVDYDSDIAVADFHAALEFLASTYFPIYEGDRILFLVGNDFFHVDGPASDARGNRRGGATTAGTAQDIDTRLKRLFTVGRKVLTGSIDRLLTCGLPVDVHIVPGNHDAEQMYRMGEVLNAWYRADDRVEIQYGPRKRSFYNYGANTFMFTHGEEYKRQRDPLPLIFSQECPPDWWVKSDGGLREIHTGHNHIGRAGRYMPTADLDESRAVRVRSLAGFTPEDSWHYEEGYRHKRTASVLAFREDGVLSGIHEFNL